MKKFLLEIRDHNPGVTPETPTIDMTERIYIGIKENKVVLLSDTLPLQDLQPIEALQMIVDQDAENYKNGGKAELLAKAIREGFVEKLAELYKKQVA